MKNKPVLKQILSLSLIALVLIAFNSCCNKQADDETGNAKITWAEKLGYPAGAKVIMLHADDVGMCEEANIAATDLLVNDYIQSAAIMAPCPNADEAILWAIDHPDEDIGMHLTLTAEWTDYRWAPLTPAEEVPGLIDPEGMMWDDVMPVVMHASAEEVEKEIRAQIDKAIAMGHQPTHIDTHMGTLFGSAGFMKAFFKVAEEYGIPANAIDLSDTIVANKFREAGYPIDEDILEIIANYTLPKVDNFTSAPRGDSYENKIENFKTLIKELPAGLTEIIFHPAVGSDFLKATTGTWQQRIWEYEMFSDPGLIAFFKEEGIIFTNWIEIMKRFNEAEL